MNSAIHLIPPLTDDAVLALRAGDRVRISGVIYTARDAAHRRLVGALKRGEPPPFDLRGAILYYVGPTPPRPGQVIGSAGPTTAERMDPYTPYLHSLGLKATIGKGKRGPEVKEALRQHKAVYLAAIGGAAAFLMKAIREARVIAYEDLGTEAIRRLVVEDFPAFVINDCHGGDYYQEGIKAYATGGKP